MSECESGVLKDVTQCFGVTLLGDILSAFVSHVILKKRRRNNVGRPLRFEDDGLGIEAINRLSSR